MPRVRDAVRSAREPFPLSAVASVAGLDEANYLAWEAGETTEARADIRALVAAVGLDLADLWDHSHARATRSLHGLWSLWGAHGGASRAALDAVTEWARKDDTLTLHAATVTDRDSQRKSLADRGVPEAAGSVFSRSSLPKLDLPYVDSDFHEMSVVVTADVRKAFGVPEGEAFDPWLLADRFDVPAGLAPLGTALYSATIRVLDGYAVVISSSFTAPVRWRALTHALVHLAAGDVLAGACHWVWDEDDDSIYGCSPMQWQLCSLVEHVVEELLDPAAAAAARAEWFRIKAEIEADTYDFEPAAAPEPVRLDGEEPGYWEAYDVRVPAVSLRRELGRTNADAIVPGSGEHRWPGSLARRWVAVVDRGFGLPVQDVERFPFGTHGCPTVDDVEQALWRERIVRAQLKAWNEGQVHTRFVGR
jgi:hypothetical protein